MSYISHVDYKKMMNDFKKGTPKQMLTEDLEQEGNAFTAGLAKAKKGQEFKIGDKSVKDTSNYDAPLKESDKSLISNLNTWLKNFLTPEGFRDVKTTQQEDGSVELSWERGEPFPFIEELEGELDVNVEEKQGFENATKPGTASDDMQANYIYYIVTSNHDASMEEASYTDNYEGSWGYREGKMKESHPGMDKWYEDFENGLQNLVKNGYIHKNQYQYFYDALDHVDPIQDYGHMSAHDAAKEFVDDLRTKDAMQHDEDQFEKERGGYDSGGDDFNDGEFWENEIKKLKEIAGIKSHDDGPEDDNTEEREKRAKKMEDDDTEAENAERDEVDEDGGEAGSKINMRDPNAAAEVVAQKYGTQLKPELAVYKKSHNNYIQAIRQYDNKDPKFREINAAHNKLVKDFQNNAINLAGEEMLASGMSKVEVRNLLSGYGYFEDWLPDYISILQKKLGDVAEGLHMPPLQTTGPTIDVNEDQAPFGMSVLSPDERKQLKEYINSYKTIKTEISKLLEKAGKSGQIMENEKKAGDEAVPAERKTIYRDPTTVPTQHKHSNLGGNRTGLVMTKAEMWENEEGEHERIESMLDTKLHDAFHKVTGMIMKDLMADGFDGGDIKNFLQHEIDEKAKEAINAQHDF